MDQQNDLLKYEILKKEIPLNTFLLIGEFNNIETINNLKIKIKDLSKTSSLNYKTNVKGLFTGFHSLHEDIDFLKFLKSIKKHLEEIGTGGFIIKECWGNILKKEEEVLDHAHSMADFCGILYLTEGGPGTYFRNYDLTIEEKIGRFILFHPYLYHSVKKMTSDIERYTLAFNAYGIKFWDNEPLLQKNAI